LGEGEEKANGSGGKYEVREKVYTGRRKANWELLGAKKSG
jgi:hypothetical protein